MELLRDRNGRYVVKEGPMKTVVAAVRSNEKSPARDFLESLWQRDRPAFTKFRALFEKIAKTGLIRNTTQFRKEEGDIWSFKHGQCRIACFQDGRCWVLTHGFEKKRGRWRKEDLKKAENIRADDLARIEAAKRH